MGKIISYFTTILFFFSFAFLLLFFHPIQVVLRNLFGYSAHKKSVDILNFFLVKILWLTGAKTVKCEVKEQYPSDRPIIFVSNHQSMFDIPGVIWFMRKHHPKFVSKKELAKGVPSISYNLKHGGSALIDRKDKEQALSAIKKLGEFIEKNNYSACIFPEGTRSRDGVLKEFKIGGLIALIESSPSCIIVPVVVKNTWKILRNGGFPIPTGMQLSWTFLPSIEPKNYNTSEYAKLLEDVRNIIAKELNQA
jgi:1-acyl-sn-glycerol-3-phosphate acyltransferase